MPSPRLTLIVAVAACALLGWAAPASAEPADGSTLTQLVLVVDDLDSTLSRARHAAALTPYHPAISSALAEAEAARLEVAWIAARKGPLSALWQAGEARELALLVLEQARVAWMAGAVAAAPPLPSGSGGEIP